MELFAFLRCLDCLYAIPLALATGMVYAASRYENIQEVLRNGLRIAVYIGGFLLVVLFLMLFLFR
ncbi:MAG: hypothetical protein Q4C70_04015 [Planctomycetia bacterium]|nr:hypothetical protein [Planctomycetia bacterium]